MRVHIAYLYVHMYSYLHGYMRTHRERKRQTSEGECNNGYQLNFVLDVAFFVRSCSMCLCLGKAYRKKGAYGAGGRRATPAALEKPVRNRDTKPAWR